MPDTYLKLNDGLPEHRKIVDAGGDAGWLHVCAMAYASRNLTDGIIPIGMVPRLSDRKQPTKLATRLIEVKLWHAAGHDCPRCPQPGPNEYVIHDYLDHQRSAAKVDEIKAKRAAAGRSGGTRKAANARGTAKPKSKQPSSNLLDGWQEAVEAKGTPDTEVVLRTTRAEEPLRGSQAEADIPPSAGASAPRAARSDELPNAGNVVAAWIEAAETASGERPANRLIAQVGRQARELIGEGKDPDRLVLAAAAAGRKGFADLGRELLHMGGAPAKKDPPKSRNSQILSAARQRAQAAEQQANTTPNPRGAISA